MSAMMKHDGRAKFRAHPQPSLKTRRKLWKKGSTRPTPIDDKGTLKTYRKRAS
jgi:hypothetical protein